MCSSYGGPEMGAAIICFIFINLCLIHCLIPQPLLSSLYPPRLPLLFVLHLKFQSYNIKRPRSFALLLTRGCRSIPIDTGAPLWDTNHKERHTLPFQSYIAWMQCYFTVHPKKKKEQNPVVNELVFFVQVSPHLTHRLPLHPKLRIQNRSFARGLPARPGLSVKRKDDSGALSTCQQARMCFIIAIWLPSRLC